MPSCNGALKKLNGLLAATDGFREAALAIPDQIDRALELVDRPDIAAAMLAKADGMAEFARRVKADKEIMDAIGYGRLKIVAKIAELIPPLKRGPKSDVENPLPDNGFSLSTITKYRKVFANLDKTDDYYARCREDESDKRFVTTDGFIRFAEGKEVAHVGQNSGVPEWYTPAEYIDAAREVMGEIELDPASSHIAQRTVGANRYYTREDDGLAQSWQGKVWMNPPYSMELVRRFMGKLCAHIEAGDIPEAIVLVNNATETGWFQAASNLATALCFPAGRVRFLDENGYPGAPLQGQALLYFGQQIEKFTTTFRRFGFCATGVFTHGL